MIISAIIGILIILICIKFVVCYFFREKKKNKDNDPYHEENLKIGRLLIDRNIAEENVVKNNNPFYKIQRKLNKITGEIKFKVMFLHLQRYAFNLPLFFDYDPYDPDFDSLEEAKIFLDELMTGKRNKNLSSAEPIIESSDVIVVHFKKEKEDFIIEEVVHEDKNNLKNDVIIFEQ